MMTLDQALGLLGERAHLVGEGQTLLQRVHSDSRTIQPGDLFVALRGEAFDGHDYLAAARDAGAAAAMAERGLVEARLSGLQVPDSLAALQQLAGAWRRRWSLPLAAVVGSNGKTTVTQMTAAVLQAWLGPAAFATQGNLNNHIGVPLTLLRLRGHERAGVLELGTNHPGEIALLADLVQPDVVLLNNTQREHQEFLHGLDAVARENGSAIAALGATGTVVMPASDPGTAVWRQLAADRRVIDFGLDESGEVRGQVRWEQDHWHLRLHTPQGDAETTLHIAGRHNALNGVAAAATALALGAPLEAVAAGLAAFRPVAGRSRTLALPWQGRALTLVDDAYNANPDSVIAAIDVLAELPGPHWLILGDMAEVGSQGPQFHREVGRHAAARGIEVVWTFGTQSAEAANECGARHFTDMDSLQAALRTDSPAAASVLVKGSRSMKMERVVRTFQDAKA